MIDKGEINFVFLLLLRFIFKSSLREGGGHCWSSFSAAGFARAKKATARRPTFFCAGFLGAGKKGHAQNNSNKSSKFAP